MVIRILILMTMTISSLNAGAQEEIRLYKSGIPNNKESVTIAEHILPSTDGITRVTGVSDPKIYAYYPEKKLNTGKAIIICPGGGYQILAIGYEGEDVAKRFAALGITAFVLKYRLPNDRLMLQKETGPLQDIQRAIQLVRENAKDWQINPDQIGVAGFSAGGHLASTAGTHFQKAYIDNPKGINLRPDFMLLIYPLISMKSELTHKGSQVSLLGDQPSEDQVILFSNEEQITKNTPPAFLVHAEDDIVVPIGNSRSFHNALEKQGISTKLLAYPKGGHGFGLENPTSEVSWLDLFVDWLNKITR